MPQLLISVRSVSEARIALEAGADIIDVKEPVRGSLGSSSRQVIEEVVAAVAGRAPVSIALGEWHASADLKPVPGITWAKVGLSQRTPRTYLCWLQLQCSWQPTRLLGVVYADHQRVHSPPFHEVLRWVKHSRAGAHRPGILFDTAIKDGRGLLHWHHVDQLKQFKKQCAAAGCFLALAGSLSRPDIERLKQEVQPDVIAVRGLVCAGSDRQARVQKDRVQSLAACLRAGSERSSASLS